MCPLSYVLRADAAVPVPAPTLARDAPYSVTHGSVKAEMVARLSHTHALFSTDNGLVFDDIEEATRGSKYQPTIAPFKRSKDGRGAFMALKEQFTGPAVWDKKKTNAMEFLQTRKFTGTGSLTLESFLAQHRSAYVTLQRCADNVNCQLPDERSRVQYLLDNIQAEDPNVRAAISSIRMDDTPTGRRNNFESAVAFLLPTDPVAKKHKGKRPAAEISAATGEKDKRKLGDHKPGRGATGVEFRYYEPHEFKKLTKDQVTELLEYRKKNGQSPPPRGGKRQSHNKKLRAAVSSCLRSELKEMMSTITPSEPEKPEEDYGAIGRALIASMKALSKKSDKGGEATVSALAPAMKPKAKTNADKGSKISFANDAPASDPDAEIAASKLVTLWRLMGAGGKMPPR